MLKTPILHLLSHGIELLLKYPLLHQGKNQMEVRSLYGHDLNALWQCDDNENLRAHVLHAARELWGEAKASGRWPAEHFEGDPCALLPEQVGLLAFLHGRESAFALRYAIKGRQKAPRPAFLIDAFGDVAERTLMNPQYLDFKF